MSRLHAEWRRLYLPLAVAGQATAGDDTSLIDAEGRVRAMVLALGSPADWTALSAVWQAVQRDLGLPAPGIAVSGVDGYELWFSLAQAVSVAEAHGFLESLRTRYLGHVKAGRVGVMPDLDVGTDLTPRHTWHTGTMPGQQVIPDQWSAFIAPDLGPMFAETPWLDIPPSPEGQAELLSRLQSIKPADWQAALALLQPPPAEAAAEPAHSSSTTADPQTSDHACTDPKRFLIGVMNDPSVSLALRIEAAKALLPYSAHNDGA